MKPQEYSLSKMSAVISAWHSFKEDRNDVKKEKLNKAAVDLIGFLLETYGVKNLPCEDDAKKIIHELLTAHDGKVDEQLKIVPESLIPVVIMREVLKTHRVSFNPKNVINWHDFVKIYGKFIMLS